LAKNWSTGFGPKRLQLGGLTIYSALFSRHLPGADFPGTSAGARRIAGLPFGKPVQKFGQPTGNLADQ
jgi:hypothetical protein